MGTESIFLSVTVFPLFQRNEQRGAVIDVDLNLRKEIDEKLVGGMQTHNAFHAFQNRQACGDCCDIYRAARQPQGFGVEIEYFCSRVSHITPR